MTQLESGDRVATEWLNTRVPPEILQTLTDEQRSALISALRVMPWKTHPVDLRFTIPFFGRKYYFALVSGRDKRSPVRLRSDRKAREARSMGGMMFVLAIAAVFYLIVIAGMFFFGKVVEF